MQESTPAPHGAIPTATLPWRSPPMPDMTASLHDWAQWYAAQGIPVFPCRGKEPLTPNGFYDATTDPFDIAMHWRRYPDANIATPTGGEYWVLDTDPRHGGDLTLTDYERQYGTLPRTATVLTGGHDHGHHGWWLMPQMGTVRHKANLGPGLDVLARGGYVIVPPSIHPETGRPYLWDIGADLEDPGICAAPAWLLALVGQAGSAESARKTPTMAPGEPIVQGTRETTLVDMGIALRHAGGDYATILAALTTANTRCEPPLDQAALERMSRSVTRYEVDAVLEVPHKVEAAPEAIERPIIRITPDITAMVDAGQTALLALPGGIHLFQQTGRLAIIARGMPSPRWLRRPPSVPLMQEPAAAYLDQLASQAACWQKYDKRAKAWHETTPPARFAPTLQGQPSWPFPPLEGIIHSPTLRPDGSLLDTPGYDIATGVFFDSNGTTFPPLSSQPSLDDARQALVSLQEVIQNFPFLHTWHQSAWLAAIISLVCRATIEGCVPLFGITSTIQGSGKSLLADTIALIGTGRLAARWSHTNDELEEEKRLLAMAMDGDALVCIDNVNTLFGSSVLAKTLTAESIKGRILGTSKTVEISMQTVFLCTGNNLQYSIDMARRVVPIALDPKTEHPEERTGFHQERLLVWLRQERPRLTLAALTLVKAFFTAGRPQQGLSAIGGFDAWSDLVRNTLVWVGMEDPCTDRRTLTTTVTPEFEILSELLTAWDTCYGTSKKTLHTIAQDIAQHANSIQGHPNNAWNDLQYALGQCDFRFDGKRLDLMRIGHKMRAWQGRIVDGKCFRSPEKDRQNKALWQLQMV